MSVEVQIVYAIVAASCAIISTVLRWRKHTREAKQARLSEHERVQHIRSTIRSQILDSLVANLLPIRGIYLGLSDEERLRRELELIFDKPQEVQAVSARFCALLELQTYPNKLGRALAIQTLSLIIGLLAFIGALLPLADWLRDKPIEYSPVSQVALVALIVSGVVFTIAAIMRWRLEHRLQSMLQAT